MAAGDGVKREAFSGGVVGMTGQRGFRWPLYLALARLPGCSPALRPCGNAAGGDVLPGECHRLSKRVFLHQIQAHAGASRAPPGAILGDERCRILYYELLLLVRSELDHSALEISM